MNECGRRREKGSSNVKMAHLINTSQIIRTFAQNNSEPLESAIKIKEEVICRVFIKTKIVQNDEKHDKSRFETRFDS
jgi:hypothetical protein